MRDLEEMVSDPDLRSQIAMVRDRARQLRIDVKRHSKAPDWDLVRTSIYGPMLELQKQIAEMEKEIEGELMRSRAANRTGDLFRSTAIRCRRSLSRWCGSTTNDCLAMPRSSARAWFVRHFEDEKQRTTVQQRGVGTNCDHGSLCSSRCER